MKLDADLRRETGLIDGVPCEWIIPKPCRKDQVLLYLHGGGFVFKLTSPHLKMGAYLARKSGLRTLMVDYRTAPKNPFPAALDDCISVYQWLIEQGISAQDIVVAGDSAGGNLTLTMIMKLRDNGDPMPAAAVCISPVTDLTPKEDPRKDFRDPLLPRKAVQFYSQAYIGNGDAYHPLISPVFGDMKNFPPLLIHVGENEILLNDAEKISGLARDADVDVRLEIYPRMWHVWQLNLSLPQAIQSLDDIARFFRNQLTSK